MVNVNTYNELLAIAQSAYGSGAFEGAKGGNGYVGQYTDVQGNTHVVKVLTHSAERKEYANAAERGDNNDLAVATQQLKANLIAIADGANPQLGDTIREMLEDAQTKAAAENMTAGREGAKVGLLSRKIVAQAISAIAKEASIKDGRGHAFSWADVNDKNRAGTVEDTRAATVNRDLEENANQIRDLRLHREWDALEKKFGNWRAPIPQPEIGQGANLDFRDLISRVDRISSQWNLQNVPLCKAAKTIGFLQLPLGGAMKALREKLETLNDNLTASQMLDELRDVLDVDDPNNRENSRDKMDRGYVMAFRLLLEKRAAAEE